MSHHRGGIRHHLHSGRDNVFYLYEEPECDIAGLDASGNQKPNTLERRSPLPAGRYWVDVFGKNIPTAQRWFTAFQGLGVHVEATNHFPASDPNQVRDWYLFSYSPVGGVPVIWDTSLGYPTIAAASVKSSQDTVSGADLPLGPLDELSNWMNETEQKLGGSLGATAQLVPFAILGGLAIGGYAIVKQLGLIGKAKQSVRRLRNK